MWFFFCWVAFTFIEMSKDSFYFSHDYNTRTDDKIKKLIRTHGIAGYGLFWCLVEDLYNNANALQLDYEGIAYDMRTDVILVKSVINDFDLFCVDDSYFGSQSVERRLEERNNKSETARQTAFKRWNRVKINANAMPMQCDGNAIKERKGKKINDNKDISFKKPELEEVKEYCFSRSNNVDAYKWYNFYEAKGWMIGKNKMKDWKAAVRTWEDKKEMIVPQFSSGPGR